MLISTFMKETSGNTYKAEVHKNEQGHYIEYFSPNGEIIKTEEFYGKSIFYVESAAKNWVAGIKQLNG